MRWGVRRFQNEDGSLTSAGRRRYDGGSLIGKRRERQSVQTRKGLSPQAKRAIKIGAAIGVTALAAYGATRLAKSDQGQKLINELLSKGGKTLIDAGDHTPGNSDKTVLNVGKVSKVKSDDPRAPIHKYEPAPGYNPASKMSRDAKLMSKNVDELTNAELTRRAERLELANRIKKAEHETRVGKIKRVSDTINTVAAVPTALVAVGGLAVRAYDTMGSLNSVKSGTRVDGKNLYGAALEQYRKAQKDGKA